MRRLQKLVDEHNAMQPGRRRRRAGMKRVMIVKAGRYNDGEGRAQRLEAGEELETQEWYARVLVERGLARWPGGRGAGGEERGEEDMRLITDFGGAVPEEVVERLYERGIVSLEDLGKATDAELLGIKGIGAGRLKALRELC